MIQNNNVIPIFKFGSKELEEFHKAHKYDEEYEFNYRDGNCFSFLLIEKSMRQLWKKSGIQYIVNHGTFKTLETSVFAQNQTISEVIPS